MSVESDFAAQNKYLSIRSFFDIKFSSLDGFSETFSVADIHAIRLAISIN